MSQLLIIVPARGGSKRLPGKNLRQLGDRSLLAHTAAAIRGAALDASVVLSTDDDAIAEEGARLGWLVPFRRPAALATDASPTIDTVLHALDWFHDAEGGDPDAVMVLQPTSPLRSAESLGESVHVLATRADVDSVISMTALNLPPARLFLATDRGIGTPLGEDDARRPVYVPNGALYLTRTAALRRQRTLYAGAIRPLVVDALRSVDIDTAEDWHLAASLIGSELPPEPGNFDPIPSVVGAIS